CATDASGSGIDYW
nr:immunoglobulin heavy chain junction region [Macaca mulatta]